MRSAGGRAPLGAELTFEADQDGIYYCQTEDARTAVPDLPVIKARNEELEKAGGTVSSGSHFKSAPPTGLRGCRFAGDE